jgi:Aspartyl protease
MTDPFDPVVIVDVPIVFEVVGGDVVHAPMVHARVGGVATRLILDTGSTDHVLTKTLIDRAGAPTTPAEDGIDHAGAAVASWSVGDLAIEIAPVTFDLHDVIAIASPGPFEGWGVGGFLSPQHLHPTARALIDLMGDRLVVVEAAGRDRQAVDAWLAARVPGHRRLDLARAPGTTTVAIAAAVDGFEPVATMLNTGGRGTEFARIAASALATSSVEAGGSGVSGAPVMGAEAGARDVLVAGIRVPVARLVVRDEIDDVLGIIGMDVLRETALICGADPAEPVVWLVPSAWPAV